MTDRPALFRSTMVQALIAGRKTMTRRLKFSKPRPGRDKPLSIWTKVQPGDRLWVRENFWMADNGAGHQLVQYAADFRDDEIHEYTDTLTPCIHMPRRLSRLTLVVTAVKIERLKDLSDADAVAEGIYQIHPGKWWHEKAMDFTHATSPRSAFGGLWIIMHGIESFDENPELVAMTFTVHRQNVDNMTGSLAASVA